MSRTPTIFLSAGEPSGDLHGAALARALRARWPSARLLGLAGPRMQAEGVEPVADFDRLAVMGFAEVLRHLPFFARLLHRAGRIVEDERVDLVVPIDYPGFNLRLASRASATGVPVLYYIAPQVWAWHRSRAAKLAATADRLAVILPFEEAIFREYGADVRFVGHPLALRAGPLQERAAFCAAHGLDPSRRILALFPGSRLQEVERHLSVFREAAERVVEARWHLQPVIARSPDVDEGAYAGSAYPMTTDARSLLAHAHVALVKSGTTTLEAALAGVPMVIAYRTHPATFWLARRLVRVEHVGLANLVAGRRIAPELLQEEATPSALAAALLPLVDEGPARAEALEGVAEARAALRPEGTATAAERVADLAAELLDS
ncbi:MAG TPA: lipid-A-disaccharide synthase [Longimicrobiales bacterium]|nr:lipid-A-disaccharide synthase [Longimicrobiales bacterium]